MSPKPTITAVICTFRRYDRLENALESLFAQTLEPERRRVLIVDNAPLTEGAAARAVAGYSGSLEVDVITEPKPGLSHARNAALRACSSDLIAYLDDDAIAAATWLSSLVRVFEEERGVAVAGGRVSPIWESSRPKWLSNRLLGYLSLVDWAENRMEIVPPRWLAGTNIAYAAGPLRAIGGFRTDLGRRGNILLSNEELSTCEALRAAGYRVMYEPSARVEHLIPSERLTRSWFRQRAFWQAVSDVLMDNGQSEAVLNSPQELARYSVGVSGGLPNLLNFGVDHDQSGLCLLQMQALYETTVHLAHGRVQQPKASQVSVA